MPPPFSWTTVSLNNMKFNLPACQTALSQVKNAVQMWPAIQAVGVTDKRAANACKYVQQQRKTIDKNE